MRPRLLAALLLWPLAAAAQTPAGTGAPITLAPPAEPSAPGVVYPGNAPIVATPLPPPPGAPGATQAPAGTGTAAPAGATQAGAAEPNVVAPPPPAGTAAAAPAATQGPPGPAAPPAVAGAAPGSPSGTSPPGSPPGTASGTLPSGTSTGTPAVTTPGAPAAGQSAAAGAAPTPAPVDQGTPLPSAWLPQGAALLEVLNKRSAVVRTLDVTVGESVKIGTITITVRACVVRPPGMPSNAAAFLQIAQGDATTPEFQGWSVRNEPYLSMFQQRTYNVRVLGCRA
jgi:hypothetical protein